jgi:polysaccharide pyruvyl transferase WcaK-like protein
MLHATLDQLACPGREFHLLSVSPEMDRKSNDIPALRIIAARPLLLVAVYLPMSLLVWPFARLRTGRRMLSAVPMFRALLESDAVIDLSGISFSSPRGLALLGYNLACTVPALLFGCRLAKLSQAFGPFQGRAYRSIARAVLSRCAILVARGAGSATHLQSLGLKRYQVLPDTSFSMRTTERALRAAAELERAHGLKSPWIAVNPSQVVARSCAQAGIDYCGEIAEFVAGLARDGRSVALVPHSTAPRGSRNNDDEIVREICNRLPAGVCVAVFDGDYDARTLRALIGRAELLVGSRFHAIIAALCGNVPPLVIGWGHKYRELMELFGLEVWAFDWSMLRQRGLRARFDELSCRQDSIRAQIAKRLPPVINLSERNFILVRELLVG